MAKSKKTEAKCADCGLDYTDPGFVDLVIPNWAWLEISPTGHDGGLLCPTCIIRALNKKKIKCVGALMSGYLFTVSREDMTLIRKVENLENQKEDKPQWKR